MHPRIVASALATLAIAGCALAQTPKADEDHTVHHPPGTSPTVAAAAPRAAAATDAFEQQMKAMQDMHQRLQSAKTPAERAALMDSHMRLMQSGMAMMGQMRGMGGMGAMAGMGGPGTMASQGGMGMMPAQPPASGASPGAPGVASMAGMMGMHQQMERRMAMMEQMMQMMVDREATLPRK